MATVLEMNPKLAALTLMLDALGVGEDISSTAERKRIQKAVYLGQRKALDLGYRYGWYKMGPYSPTLTSDYYELAESKAAGESTNGHRLATETAERLSELRGLFQRPEQFPRPQEDWLELLASVDYLRKVRLYDDAKVSQTIEQTKKDLYPYVDLAEQKLAEYGLLT